MGSGITGTSATATVAVWSCGASDGSVPAAAGGASASALASDALIACARSTRWMSDNFVTPSTWLVGAIRRAKVTKAPRAPGPAEDSPFVLFVLVWPNQRLRRCTVDGMAPPPPGIRECPGHRYGVNEPTSKKGWGGTWNSALSP